MQAVFLGVYKPEPLVFHCLTRKATGGSAESVARWEAVTGCSVLTPYGLGQTAFVPRTLFATVVARHTHVRFARRPLLALH